MIKTTKFQTILLALCLLSVGPVKAADPVTVLVGIFLAEKMTGPDHRKARKDIPSWRITLSKSEQAMLDRLQNHPAVAACTQAADNNEPIAAYQSRKLAEFGVELQRATAKSGKTPDIASMNFERAAKAFQWCSKQAGIISTARDRSLQRSAHRFARTVHFGATRTDLAASQDFASTSP